LFQVHVKKFKTMPIKILMPALSPTMTEGNLAKWHKKAGDKVKSGDVLAEIETDKAVMEVEAVDEGVLGKILVAEGTEGVKVNEIIALLLEDGEDAASLDKVAVIGGNAATANPAAESATHEAAVAAPAVAQAAAGTGASAAGAAAIPMHQGVTVSNDAGRVFASPLARRLAAEGGLSLVGLLGSGPHGRIVREDVVQALQAKPAAAKAAPSPASSASGGSAADLFGLPEFRLEPHTTMRKVIARRLSESKQTVPHFYLTVDCQLDRLMALRHEINASLDAKISVNDFILKACAIALTKVPAANASWTEEGVRYYNQADVSVAVAIDGGLITPIVRAAQDKGLAAISREMKDLAARARDNKLKPEEFTGGTFSLSNLGMFGIKDFAAIVNPPQGCILAVGAGEKRPVVKNDALAIATVMSCTLSVDHRVVDGAVGAEFLKVFKGLIEDPIAMLV
jgi:pyruvate dehydrogenase E2 component (dihydrolipoamide acetyltransferase)